MEMRPDEGGRAPSGFVTDAGLAPASDSGSADPRPYLLLEGASLESGSSIFLGRSYPSQER